MGPVITRLSLFTSIVACILALLSGSTDYQPQNLTYAFAILACGTCVIGFATAPRLPYTVSVAALIYSSMFLTPILGYLFYEDGRFVRYLFLATAAFSLYGIVMTNAHGRVTRAARRIAAQVRLSGRHWIASTFLHVVLITLLITFTVTESAIYDLAIPFAIAFSMLMLNFACRTGSRAFVYYTASLSGMIIIAHILFGWSGSGRILLASLLLAPALLIHAHGFLNVRPIYIMVLTPAGFVLSSMLRWTRNDSSVASVGSGIQRELTEGSMIAPLDLTERMFESYGASIQSYNLTTDFLGQYALLFMQWVPRDFWPSKPIGIGRTYVDDVLGYYGYSDGHSVAVGFIGEHLYLSGSMWPLTLAITLVSIVGLRMALKRIPGDSLPLLLLFDINLLTYVWGGMASFSSRMWFFAIPIIAYMLLQRVLPARSKARA